MQFCFQGVYGKYMRYQIFEGGGGGSKKHLNQFRFFLNSYKLALKVEGRPGVIFRNFRV